MSEPTGPHHRCVDQLESAEYPVAPKVTVAPEDIPQPRRVEFGHLTQYRGSLADDRVTVERQKRMHKFGQGTHDHGPALTLYRGSLDEAFRLYKALDALFTGGATEVDDE